MVSLATACACDADHLRRLVKSQPTGMLPAFLLTSDPLQIVSRKHATARDGKQYSESEFHAFYGEYLFHAMWREALERDLFRNCDLVGRSCVTLVSVSKDDEPTPSETGAVKDFPNNNVVEHNGDLLLRVPKRVHNTRPKDDEVTMRLKANSVVASLNLEPCARRAAIVKRFGLVRRS